MQLTLRSANCSSSLAVSVSLNSTDNLSSVSLSSFNKPSMVSKYCRGGPDSKALFNVFVLFVSNIRTLDHFSLKRVIFRSRSAGRSLVSISEYFDVRLSSSLCLANSSFSRRWKRKGSVIIVVS